MTVTPATTNPTKRGWYACWLGLSERPVVLYWGARSTQWHYGPTLMRVTHYLGPLPNPAAEAATTEEL
jgi:hypothetical protein